MISNSTVIAFVIAAIFTLLLPIVILIVLGVKKKINGIPLFLGAAAFFLSQIVLRIPLLSVISGQEWYRSFAEHYYIPLVFLVCLSAGLFEETARLGGALILKKRRRFKDIISFGLGHAFCEVIILIGLTHINNIVLCMTINDTSGALAAALPPETLQTATAQLTAVDPVYVYSGLLERFSAVIFHIFATILVFKGVIQKKMRYYGLAILAHTAYNFAGVMLSRYAEIVISEAALLIIALAAGFYAIKAKEGEVMV